MIYLNAFEGHDVKYVPDVHGGNWDFPILRVFPPPTNSQTIYSEVKNIFLSARWPCVCERAGKHPLFSL